MPERLDELVGPFMDRLPTDPINGQAFEYRVGGVPIELMTDGRRLPPNTPYLSMPGSGGIRREPISKEYQAHHAPFTDMSQANNDVSWVSVLSNPFQTGQTIDSVHNHGRATFSLAPSF